jgi:hypothetical protein
MKRRLLLTSLCLAYFGLLSWQLSLYPQEKSEKSKPKVNSIEGEWVLLIWDMGGGPQSMLPDLRQHIPGHMVSTDLYIWKISKETIDEGPDIKDLFPMYRSAYKLHPEKQSDVLALNLEERERIIPAKNVRKKLGSKEKKAYQAIYYINGDYLMICIGSKSRPKNFTSSKDNPTTIYVLFRHRRKE